METNTAIFLGVIVVLALLAVAMVFLRKRSADTLRLRFGPEYERTVEAAGGRQKAESQLHQRQKRVRGLAIKPLTPEEREHYLPAWKEIQTQFVDDPKGAVVGAEQLLAEVMTHRGYPDGDFEQRSADLSVDHPVVTQNYRAAHDIAVMDTHDEVNTEDSRQALLSYRAVFRELVDEPVAGEPVTSGVVEDQASPTDGVTVDEPSRVDEPVVSEATPAADVVIDEPALSVEPDTGKEPVNRPVTMAAT